MSPQRQALMERKWQLVHESGLYRDRFTARAQSLRPLLAGADQARQGWRWLRGHPAVWVAAGVALLVARPRRVAQWGSKAWMLWMWSRRIKRWIEPKKSA